MVEHKKNNRIGLNKYKVNEYWDNRAIIGEDIYDKVCVYGASRTFNIIMDKAQKYCLLKLIQYSSLSLRGSNVLEVGCGVGRWVKIMREYDANYTGVDVSMNMIKFARKNVPDAKFLITNGRDLSNISSNSFDLVFTITVLHHITYKDKIKFINEIYRVTKEGGSIIIIEDFCRDGTYRNLFNMFPYTKKVD